MDDLNTSELKTDDASQAVSADLPVLEEMTKAGLFLGHKKSKTHPRMRPYIFTTRNSMEVIDLSQTLQALEKALEFIKSKVSNGTILLVGTTPAARALTKDLAKKLNFPYVVERWLGGTLTNFKTMAKRINYFKKLRADREAGRLDKYTKKERLGFDREIDKLTLKFSGTENMEKLPDVLFVMGIAPHLTAIREARRMNIPVVAMANTDTDPELVDYPIPANDRSKSGIEWILSKLEAAIKEAPKPETQNKLVQ